MEFDEVEKMLLSSACEDRIGLYEAIWELNGKFPTETLARKYDAASGALMKLYRHGWIRFERVAVAVDDKKVESISNSDVVDLLNNPTSWYPEYDGKTAVFLSTEEGMTKYMAK